MRYPRPRASCIRSRPEAAVLRLARVQGRRSPGVPGTRIAGAPTSPEPGRTAHWPPRSSVLYAERCSPAGPCPQRPVATAPSTGPRPCASCWLCLVLAELGLAAQEFGCPRTREVLLPQPGIGPCPLPWKGPPGRPQVWPLSQAPGRPGQLVAREVSISGDSTGAGLLAVRAGVPLGLFPWPVHPTHVHWEELRPLCWSARTRGRSWVPNTVGQENKHGTCVQR